MRKQLKLYNVVSGEAKATVRLTEDASDKQVKDALRAAGFDAFTYERIERVFSRTQGNSIRVVHAYNDSVLATLTEAADLYRCASKHCPGFTYKASDMAHPADVCKG